MMSTPTIEKVILDAIETRLLGLHTMLPGKVVAVDVIQGKCDVQPLLQRVDPAGNPVTLPVIRNCPISFYRSGSAAVYLPVKIGDSVEIKFCERSLDIWLSKGGTVDPLDARKHNLSDAVVYPGLYPHTNAPADADPDNLVVVNGPAKMSLKPSGEVDIANASGLIKMSADGKFNVQGAADELLTVLILLLTDLIGALQIDPLTGIQPAFDPSTITLLTTVKTKLQGLKA